MKDWSLRTRLESAIVTFIYDQAEAGSLKVGATSQNGLKHNPMIEVSGKLSVVDIVTYIEQILVGPPLELATPLKSLDELLAIQKVRLADAALCGCEHEGMQKVLDLNDREILTAVKNGLR